MGQGNPVMAIEAATAPDDLFSFTDALILCAWLQGRADRRDGCFDPDKYSI